MSRRAPRPLALSLERMRADLAPASTLARVQTVWPDAVGAKIAAQARPTAERDGVLTVLCSASVWAAELTMMATQVLEHVNSALAGAPGAAGAADGRTGGRAGGQAGGEPVLTELRCRTR